MNFTFTTPMSRQLVETQAAVIKAIILARLVELTILAIISPQVTVSIGWIYQPTYKVIAESLPIMLMFQTHTQ